MGRRAASRLPWRSRTQSLADPDQQLRLHIQMRGDRLMRNGRDADQPRREAEREFGEQVVTRAYCERMDRHSDRADRLREWLVSVWHDLRIAARAARRKPAYAFIVIASIALGVGANTAVF